MRCPGWTGWLWSFLIGKPVFFVAPAYYGIVGPGRAGRMVGHTDVAALALGTVLVGHANSLALDRGAGIAAR